MEIYNYDKSGVFVSRGQARPDPLETANNPDAQVYIVPARATTVMPPQMAAFETAVFCEETSTWSVVEDHRGSVVYSKTSGEAFTIKQIGPVPEDCIKIAPPKDGQPYKWDGQSWVVDTEKLLEGLRAQRDYRLARCDWTQLADAVLSAEQVQAWKDYRQALRDYPANWYVGKPWPVEPA